MRFESLPEWLHWQETLHFTEVDPGLERIGQVWRALDGSSKLPFTVITVAGTNGKGSSVAMLESILRAAGYKTGTYTSPHILTYNERICIDNQPCSDDEICIAFDKIDTARDKVSLTYFEFATLAAVDLFRENKIDVAILEVGMGGRLDAVNLFDTDIALITPISLDHTAWLGDNREKIGKEKAGIIRQDTPVVCSEKTPPESVLLYAKELSSPLYQADKEFSFIKYDDCWQWSNSEYVWNDLPIPALEGQYQLQNAVAVLQVISLLMEVGYSISKQQIKVGLTTVKLAGRFQRIPGDIELILDVTHNEQGARNLAELLMKTQPTGRTLAVVGMLKDKDAAMVASILNPSIDMWFAASLDGSRGMTSEQLSQQLSQYIEWDKIKQADTVELAYKKAWAIANKGDRILIFGSFHTVEAILRLN
ncbi:MAG: bifunctional tetrahydrofolate synthase/dihydrofolate synthase [Methylophaga sp.]|nr:bifunctional tetrahydrofolate synthase/dihydrofolate synthase [Methylophaga sp.]